MVVPRGQRRRGYIVHLTSTENLVSIWASGALLADSRLPPDVDVDELGSPKIKYQRRHTLIRCSEGGVVADYVPFYFSARSPMLFFAHTGNPLSPFRRGQAELVHLVSHVDMVTDLGYSFVVTDRNAALEYATQSSDLEDLDRLINWTLQDQKFWNDTDTEPDRMERRMAEFLVHSRCGTEAILGIGVMNADVEKRVLDILAGYDLPAIGIRRDWYY